MKWLILTLAVLFPLRAGVAQERVVVRGGELGSESAVARSAVRQFNNPSTTSIFGSFSVDDDESFEGDIAVTNGTLVVDGEVHGDLVAINADIELGRRAEVHGDILVLGGSLRRANGARVSGNTRLHRASVAVSRRGERLELQRVNRPRTTRRDRRGWTPSGGLSIVLTTGGTYNRVEGLPILVGPRIDFPSRNGGGLLIEALLIARTAGDFNSDDRQDLGYTARAELSFGYDSPVTLGARAYDRVESIEAWQLPADEIGWGTFLWHRDYRDYYLSRGVAGYIEIKPHDDLTLRGSLARNEEMSAAARDPWTPFRKNDVWRPNPLIDEGTFISARGEIEYDTRSERSWSSGWFVHAMFENGTSDDVTPLGLPTTIRSAIPTTTTYRFQTAFVDIRRYERTGNGQIRLRGVAAGTIGDDPLPVQRRLSLGGPEPMPGFPFRQFTCAGTTVFASAAAMCDRLVVGQIEYRGGLSFTTHRDRYRERRTSRHGHEPWEWDDFMDWDDWFWVDGPDFVFFANAGTAWLDANGPGDIEADAGGGLEFGSLGIYAAKSLTSDLSARITIRLHRRF